MSLEPNETTSRPEDEFVSQPTSFHPLGERKSLESLPNVLFHQKLIETERAAYSVRQYAFSSLYDRLSTRPFLETVEKKWIAFQLLKGLADIHSRQVCLRSGGTGTCQNLTALGA